MKAFKHESFEGSVMLPTKRAICPQCDGYGFTERTDIDCSRMVQDMEDDGDYDGIENYYKGAYDVQCKTCKGQKIVDEFDFDYMKLNHPYEFNSMVSWYESEREYQKEVAAERRMGC